MKNDIQKKSMHMYLSIPRRLRTASVYCSFLLFGLFFSPLFGQEASLNSFIVGPQSYSHNDVIHATVEVTGSPNLPSSWARLKIHLSTDGYWSSNDNEIANLVISNIRGNTVTKNISFTLPTYPEYPCDADGLFFVAKLEASGDTNGDNNEQSNPFNSAAIDLRFQHTWVHSGGTPPGVRVVEVGGRMYNTEGCITTDAQMFYFMRYKSTKNFVANLTRRSDGAGVSYLINNLGQSSSRYFQFDLWVPSWVPMSANYEICFSAVTNPSYLDELNVDNNIACKPFCYGCLPGLVGEDENSSEIATNPVLNIKVSPNPTAGLLTLRYPVSSDELNIQLTDIRGVLLKKHSISSEEQSGNMEIDLSDLQAGVYFIRYQSPSNEYPIVKRVVKL